MDKQIRELEERVIERAKFWNDYINLLINLRQAAVIIPGNKTEPAEYALKTALSNAIDAALELQQKALAESLMVAGVGGERAEAFVRDWAQSVLDEKALEFAYKAGYIPTYWYKKRESR